MPGYQLADEEPTTHQISSNKSSDSSRHEECDLSPNPNVILTRSNSSNVSVGWTW